jgi:hypothetical protein
MEQDEIRLVITRLARPDPSGGFVVERAALLAEGRDFAALAAWIAAHGGTPQARPPAAAGHGLHRSERHEIGGQAARPASQYLLPAGSLA